MRTVPRVRQAIYFHCPGEGLARSSYLEDRHDRTSDDPGMTLLRHCDAFSSLVTCTSSCEKPSRNPAIVPFRFRWSGRKSQSHDCLLHHLRPRQTIYILPQPICPTLTHSQRCDECGEMRGMLWETDNRGSFGDSCCHGMLLKKRKVRRMHEPPPLALVS